MHFIITAIAVLALCWIAVALDDASDELTRIRLMLEEDDYE